MKRILVLLVLCSTVLLPLCGTSFIRMNYIRLTRYLGADGIAGNGMGMSYSYVPDNRFGFYLTAEPYILFDLRQSESGAKLSLLDAERSGYGTALILGIGNDSASSRSGIAFGGGLLLGYDYFRNALETTHTLSAGLGMGTNVYFPVGKGKMQIAIGATLGWNPLSSQHYEDMWSTYFEPSKFILSVGIGLGWKSELPPIDNRVVNQTADTSVAESTFVMHNDDLIVPKERVGNYYLTMSREEILPELGRPDAIFYGGRQYTLEDDPHEAYFVFRSIGISFQFRGRNLVGMTVLDPRYQTAEGLKVGSTKEEIKEIMGSLGTPRGGEGYYRFNSMRLNLEFSGNVLRELEITEY